MLVPKLCLSDGMACDVRPGAGEESDDGSIYVDKSRSKDIDSPARELPLVYLLQAAPPLGG